MTTKPVDAEREAFMAWLMGGGSGTLRTDESGDYTLMSARNMWDGWQARAALADTPDHPLSDEQIETIWRAHTNVAWGETLISPTVFARHIEHAHGIKGDALLTKAATIRSGQ